MVGFLCQMVKCLDALADIATGKDVVGDAAIGGNERPDQLFHEKKLPIFLLVHEAAGEFLAILVFAQDRPEIVVFETSLIMGIGIEIGGILSTQFLAAEAGQSFKCRVDVGDYPARRGDHRGMLGGLGNLLEA